MKNYLILQIKRCLKFLPFVLITAICLVAVLSVFFKGITGLFSDAEEKKPITIGVTGDTDNDYLQFGITAMQTMDDTRYSIIFKEMDEDEARTAMNNNEISAYAIFPEDFIEKALRAEIEPVTFVTATNNNDLATLFKNELSKVIMNIMIYSEKGTYGLEEALYDNNLQQYAYELVNRISTSYISVVLNRSDVYTTQESGFSAGMGLTQYFVCGITVLMLFMMGLPYAIIHIKKDYALNRLLISKGHSCTKQLFCEYVSHLLALIILTVSIFCTLAVAMPNTTEGVALGFDSSALLSFLPGLLPILFMLCTFNLMIFELSDNIVSGMLIHFFLCLCMCYVSGCMYPIHTFPVPVQKLSGFLPTGAAVNWLSDIFANRFSLITFVLLVGYSLLFFAFAVFVRKQKTSNKTR